MNDSVNNAEPQDRKNNELWYIFLDIDGVLITTPLWKPDVLHEDGYSDFNQNCVHHFNALIARIETRVIITSSRRHTKTKEELTAIFQKRGIHLIIEGMLPSPAAANTRKEELTLFIKQNSYAKYIILDDDKSLHELPEEIKRYCIITTYFKGFDKEALVTARIIMDK